MKKKIIILLCICALILLFLFFIWKIPFQNRLNGLALPDGVETVKTEISWSDVYGSHILVERIVRTELSINELTEFIKENSSDFIKDHINVRTYSFMRYEWDDTHIVYGMDIPEEEENLYYVITVNTDYGKIWY